MTIGELAIEAVRVALPLGIAYIGLLKTRTELDILYGKFRGGDGTRVRKRWYHRLKKTRKPLDD